MADPPAQPTYAVRRAVPVGDFWDHDNSRTTSPGFKAFEGKGQARVSDVGRSDHALTFGDSHKADVQEAGRFTKHDFS